MINFCVGTPNVATKTPGVGEMPPRYTPGTFSILRRVVIPISAQYRGFLDGGPHPPAMTGIIAGTFFSSDVEIKI